MMAKTDIVVIEKFYAVRKQTKWLWFVKTEFLDLESNRSRWYPRDYDFFPNCLTYDFEKAKNAIAKYGCDLGTPCLPGIISVDEFADMNKLAETDEGMKDLLLKAKEFFTLKRVNK